MQSSQFFEWRKRAQEKIEKIENKREENDIFYVKLKMLKHFLSISFLIYTLMISKIKSNVKYSEDYKVNKMTKKREERILKTFRNSKNISYDIEKMEKSVQNSCGV